MSAPEFERVLGEHALEAWVATPSDGGLYARCACGERLAIGGHRDHLAAALNAEVARWLADEGTREIAARAIHAHQEYSTYWDDSLGERGREFYLSLASAALAALAALAPTDTTDKGGAR